MDAGDKENGRRIASIIKAFDIIEELEESGSMTASELAAARDMPVSTAYVYLQTLAETGYVIEEEREYRLSLQFLRTGGQIRQRLGVFQYAQSEMLDLCWTVGERVGLGVEENGHRVQIWQIDGEQSEYDDNYVGEHTYMHWTALGKMLIASMDDDEIERTIDRYGLPRATEHTITDADVLFEEIEQIREQGYATEDEERKPGMRSISVPLTDTEGNTWAALGIAAAKTRMGPSTCSQYLRMLQEKANLISLRYNY
ncbi:IclR family transcriptional regulator [Halarchaeum nitratireducens]|uniref:DNA-binding transcriptional regulator KdgR n=1 Tax=Halarchaeum nitratireducens TaxID=489913 RepID=A0A830GEF6_9EURY|nr:IclR family transcriptional regulator [Halarchaeum nitratireducens]GGN24543.1 DNA-binding transcriptional regulator KdgR [Halarchaeum nitratireducens]